MVYQRSISSACISGALGVLITLCGVQTARSDVAKLRAISSSSCPLEGRVPHGMGQSKYALAISGGGYRAMLFHVGALWRLNELGMLPKFKAVSSVSGGSIVAAVLATNWERLNFDDEGVARCFKLLVADPLIQLAKITIDRASIIWGRIPYLSAAGMLETQYASQLFGDLTLAHLPASPQFIFNAVNYQTAEAWTFTKERMGDATVGYVKNPKVSLARVVAASSAYPPWLSPLQLDLTDETWDDSPFSGNGVSAETLDKLRRSVLLADGGIVDNLGLDAIATHKGSIFVSDGGGGVDPVPEPSTNIVSQSLRIINIMHGQPTKVRINNLIDQFSKKKMDGVYWTIRKIYTHRDVPDTKIDPALVFELARTPTRLKGMGDAKIRQIINLGYAAVDNALPFLDELWHEPGYSKDGWWQKLSCKYPYAEQTLGSELEQFCRDRRG